MFRLDESSVHSLRVVSSPAYFQCQNTAADGMKQLAAVSEREYLFTNNPLITSDGQWDQTSISTQDLALNETESENPGEPLTLL